MKRKIYKSFRFEFVIYALISLLLAMLTVALITGVAFIINNALNNSNASGYNRVQENDKVTEYFNNISNTYEPAPQENNQLDTNSIEPFENFNFIVFIFITCLLLVLVIILFVTYFLMFTKKFNNYLNEIAYGIRQFSEGSFDTRIYVDSNDELMEIADNLNHMAVDIKSLLDKERGIENKKNDLITNVAHDLRTPLTSIIGYLDLVSNKELTDELRTKYISIAYSKSKRLEYLIDDLFTYTKLEFGEIKPSLTEVDIIKMMEQMLDEFYPRFQENSLEYSFITNEKSIIINADGALLGRAFANLFENAIKYGIDGKNIIIRAEKVEKCNLSIDDESVKNLKPIDNEPAKSRHGHKAEKNLQSIDHDPAKSKHGHNAGKNLQAIDHDLTKSGHGHKAEKNMQPIDNESIKSGYKYVPPIGSDGNKYENYIIIEITNFGEIIPKESLENIFNKFYRIENSRNVNTGGTGLGLTITKNIITMHKGVINVKSDLSGTTFCACLPLNFKEDMNIADTK